MLVRRSGPLILLAMLAVAGCGKQVHQQAPRPVLALATFDPGVPGVRAATLPLPNDLALKGAPSLPAGATRTALFQLMDLGGWPPDMTLWSPVPGIAVFVRTETFDDATGMYAPSAPPAALDTASFTAQTVALVKLDGASPTAVPVAAPTYVAAQGLLIFHPASGTLLAPGRYVFALRGGANGIKTSDGLPLEADEAIALVAPNKDLSNPDNQPPVDLTPAQVLSLEQLRASFGIGMRWAEVPSETVCRGALGIPAAVPFPEARCWLPPAATSLPTPGVAAAFTGVDQVFPHQEIASIQTFAIFTAP